MTAPQDILFDETGDLAVSSDGDFVCGDATLQHQNDILMAMPGHYRNNPKTGVGILTFLNDESPADMLQAVKEGLTADGMKVKTATYKNGKLIIEARYE